ncbi:hypothetical protein C8R45DRAFT_558866, partial [Mycena sanguinolenta]
GLSTCANARAREAEREGKAKEGYEGVGAEGIAGNSWRGGSVLSSIPSTPPISLELPIRVTRLCVGGCVSRAVQVGDLSLFVSFLFAGFHACLRHLVFGLLLLPSAFFVLHTAASSFAFGLATAGWSLSFALPFGFWSSTLLYSGVRFRLLFRFVIILLLRLSFLCFVFRILLDGALMPFLLTDESSTVAGAMQYLAAFFRVVRLHRTIVLALRLPSCSSTSGGASSARPPPPIPSAQPWSCSLCSRPASGGWCSSACFTYTSPAAVDGPTTSSRWSHNADEKTVMDGKKTVVIRRRSAEPREMLVEAVAQLCEEED